MSHKKVNIPEGAKVRVVWNVLPYDYNEQNKASIKELVAKKYGISKHNVEIAPVVKSLESEGAENSEIRKELKDLCDTQNQLALYKKYLELYKVENYDWDTIVAIDGDVNANMNYEKYERYKKYKLKWIKWDNFLSYGEGNFFDFENLKGLVLMNGQPANQTGKTSFAIDLIHFLLFGRCTPLKAKTNNEIFNRHIKKCTQVRVEGCINIDGQDYVIKRTLNRPAKYTEKSKISGTLEYFRVDGENNYEALQEFDSSNADVALNEESVAKTNKAIKDAIGREEDFDMIICSTSKSLSDLIDNTGDTERGKLMTRWLGLDIIDDKYAKAKEVYAQQMGNALFKTKNKEVLKQEIEQKQQEIESNKQSIKHIDDNITLLEQTIAEKVKEADELKTSKKEINVELLKLDKQSIENKMSQIVTDGKNIKFTMDQKDRDIESKQEELSAKQAEINAKQIEIDNFGEVSLTQEEINKATQEFTSCSNAYSSDLNKYNEVKKKKESLQNGEFCPTCRQRLANVNNSALIAECDAELATIQQKGKQDRELKDKAEEALKAVNALIEKREQRNKLIMQKSTLESQYAGINSSIDSIRLAKSALEIQRKEKIEEYREQERQLKEYEANKEAIEQNAETDRKIMTLEQTIDGYRRDLSTRQREKQDIERDNKDNQKIIENNTGDIKQIEKEEKSELNWQIYLNMLGKNGVAKMEIRELTPIINIKLKELLSGVVDFDVEVEVTDKNDVVFNIVTNDDGDIVKAKLASGSGLERTCSALALRFVLGIITSIPQPNFFVLDEILDCVATENYDKVKKLFDAMINSKNGVDFILHCTHIEEIKDWHKSIITINKTNRISTVSYSNNM